MRRKNPRQRLLECVEALKRCRHHRPPAGETEGCLDTVSDHEDTTAAFGSCGLDPMKPSDRQMLLNALAMAVFGRDKSGGAPVKWTLEEEQRLVNDADEVRAHNPRLGDSRVSEILVNKSPYKEKWCRNRSSETIRTILRTAGVAPSIYMSADFHAHRPGTYRVIYRNRKEVFIGNVLEVPEAKGLNTGRLLPRGRKRNRPFKLGKQETRWVHIPQPPSVV